MPTTPEYSPEQVSTEPQRQALDAMSNQLVANLNAMIREQNERAERFAATQHSVSALPGQMDLPAVQPLPELAPGVAPLPAEPLATAVPPLPSTPTQAPRQRRAAKLPPRPTTPLRDEPPAPLPPKPRIKIPTGFGKNQESEQGCSATSIIIGIVIFLFLARACS